MKSEPNRPLSTTTVSFAKAVPGLSELALKRFVRRAAVAVRLLGSINVRVSGNRELRTLNCRFRGKGRATDVLSFPAANRLAPNLAGDIAISADIAAENARALGHSTALEIRILVLHGVLHLAGYDHEADDGEMAALEGRLRRKLRLPTGLIERTTHTEAGQRKPVRGLARRRSRVR